MDKVKIDKELCSRCGICVSVCPSEVFVENEKIITPENGDKCFSCGHCMASCPEDAIRVEGMDETNFSLLDGNELVEPGVLKSFLRKRRSVRSFTDRIVDRKILEELADTGRYAPTGKNAQNVGFTFVTDPEKVRDLCGMTLDTFGALLNRFDNPFFRLAVTFKEGRKMVESGRKLVPIFNKARERFDRGEDPLFYNAPVLAVVHASKGLGTPKDNCVYAMYNMVLAAEALGLSSCINGYFVAASDRDRRIGEYLSIPETSRIYSAAAIGYSEHKYLRLVDRRLPDISFL